MVQLNLLQVLYLVLGGFMLLCYVPISQFFYKLALLFTNKIGLDELLIYRVDSSNQELIYKLAKRFTFLLGLTIIVLTLFFHYY